MEIHQKIKILCDPAIPLWVFTQKNGKQDLEEGFTHPCS